MTDTANESMTAEKYREQFASSSSVDVVASDYDEVYAIDPGKDTGLAYASVGELETHTTDFWGILLEAGVVGHTPNPSPPALWIVEAPYASRPGMSANRTAIAYRSGQVAREAELIVQALERVGQDVIEHDPSQQGEKWDSDFAHKVVGGWDGPDNEHVRDAIRLLVAYGVVD